MSWNNWNDTMQDRAWCYRLGHTSAHFMQLITVNDRSYLVSACGQVLMQPAFDAVFIADHTIKKCGRCSRVVKKQPDLLGPGAVAGFWGGATGMTSQHHWSVENFKTDGFKSRCGKIRDAGEIGEVEPDILADMGVDRIGDLPHCKKCSNYLGVDMAKNVPGKQVIKDASGDLISVELVQADLTAEQLGKMVTGGRVLADPVDAWIAIDDDLGLLDCSVIVNKTGVFVEGLMRHHLQKRKVVIIDEVKS